MKSMAKEIIIIIAMIILTVLVLGIIFYDYIPTYKIIPEVKKYVADSEIATELEGIESEEINRIIVKPLTIDSTDLDMYQAKKSYTKGKGNPFSDYSKVSEDSTQASGSASSSSSTSSTNNKESSNSTNESNNTSGDTADKTTTNSTSNDKSSSEGGKFLNTAGTK